MTANLQSQQINDLIAQGQVTELRQLVRHMPLPTVLPLVRAAMKKLTDQQHWEIWRQGGRSSDRLAGILCVSELRMPPKAVFGPAKLSNGNKETDYDRARTFILETRSKERITSPIQGMFYPELAAIPVEIRAMTLAGAHLNCNPTSNRQLNLFSMCGAFNRQQARVATHKRTTCALFARSVLVSAGDGRFTSNMLAKAAKQLYLSTDMLMAIGVERENLKITSSEWVSALPDKGTSADSPQHDGPSVGDIFMVAIPSSGWVHSEKILADSGHVGFVVSVNRGKDRIELATYDGGQGADGLRSTFTKKRVFTKNSAGHWEQTSHARVKGELRILVGWVDMSKITANFQKAGGMLMDGRTYHTTL